MCTSQISKSAVIGLRFFSLQSANVCGAGTRDEPLRTSTWEAILCASFIKSGTLYKPFPGNTLKTSQEILRFKPCWDGFSYCLIANVISRSCQTKNTAYLYMVSKHFFFELTGILLNYDRLLTLLHTPRVVTCGSILLNTKHTKEWK